MISYVYAAGVIGASIGWIQILRQFDDLSALPLRFSLGILTILYAIIIAECILRPATRQIDAEIEKKSR